MSIIANTSSLPNNKIIIIKSEMVLQDFHTTGDGDDGSGGET